MAQVPDLSQLLDVVGAVAEDKDLAEQAEPFLQAVQDPAAEVTAFAPVNAAFAPLDGVEFNPAAVLMFHAVPGMMEPGQAYDTAAGPDAGQLTIGEEGDTVTGPCNSANVAMTVDVCGSVVHVVDAVLLPASFCEGDEAAASEEDDEDKDDHDHEDHDHDHDQDHRHHPHRRHHRHHHHQCQDQWDQNLRCSGLAPIQARHGGGLECGA